jgi:hypothetical protein
MVHRAAGFVFDSQVFGPSDSDFVPLKTGQTAGSTTFVPGEGPGPYYFRARLRNTGNGKHADYSPTASIAVH